MPLRSILKLFGKSDTKVTAVFGSTPESCHQAVVHLRKGAPDIPVWLFSTSEPPAETVALCKLVLVRPGSLALVFDAYRMLWPFWVALSVAPWTGGHGRWPLKLAPFLIPPFRVLLQNKHGDFFPGTPPAILRHIGHLIRDTADDVWNLLRTAAHAVGNVRRDIGHWFAGGALNIRLLLLLALGTLLRWLGYPHCRWFQSHHGNEALAIDAPPANADDVLLFQSESPRWDAEKLERLAQSSNARWILWHEGDTSTEYLKSLFTDPRAFAVSRQSHYRAWKPGMIFTAPFRTLQPGEASRVVAPISSTILVDREKLLAVGIPRTALAGTAWMLLFWRAAAAGWTNYSVGQSKKLTEQPDFPMQETAFLLRVLTDPALRRIGAREPELSRGCLAFPILPGRYRQKAAPKLKVLLVTPFLPYPLAHGGAVRIYNLCRALADRVDFTLVAIREKHDIIDYPKLLEIFHEVHVVDIDERASNDDRLPQQVRGHQSRAMRAWIGEIARSAKPDLLQIEYTHMAAFRDAAPQVPALLVEHDLTFSLYRQLATSNPSPAAEAEYQRWLNFEQRWLREYEGIWTVSEDDRQVVLRDTGRPPDRTFTVPNGVDIDRFVPGDEPTPHPEVFYVGSFRHLPNILGFEILRREVMPRVWKNFPEARLRIVAGPRYEQYWHEAGARDPRVEIHGFVEDLRPLYAKACVVAVPLEVSAGTNIKVLEAMACGKSVVSTPVGCAGLGLADGVDAVIRDGWDAFAGATCDLISDSGLRARIAAAARRTAESRFSWNAIAAAAFESYAALHSVSSR